MAQKNPLALFKGGLLLTLAGVGVGTISCSSEKQTDFTSQPAPSSVVGARTLAPELVACPDAFRPLRVAIVIDNTLSNNAVLGQVQQGPSFVGSDPIKVIDKYITNIDGVTTKPDPDFEGLNHGGNYTFRQYTAYKAILKLQKAGLAAVAANPKYAGIDVGLAHFPRATTKTDPVAKTAPTEDEMSEPVYYFGNGTGLPTKMSAVSQIASSTTFKQNVWDTLKFTYNSNGMTPYVTAFKAGTGLLVNEKKADDKRQSLMILITDGLPTDRMPSAIKAARKAMGSDVRVALVSYYESDDTNDESQNANAKNQLQTLFNDPGFNWGQEEHSTFASYWSSLLAIPQSSEVRDDYIQVSSKKLQKSVDTLLDRYLKCGSSK